MKKLDDSKKLLDFLQKECAHVGCHDFNNKWLVSTATHETEGSTLVKAIRKSMKEHKNDLS